MARARIGEVYERMGQRRLVLDATEAVVFYQVLYDEPTGTFVERDETNDQKQCSAKEWKSWAG